MVLGTDVLNYAQELQGGYYKKFTELIRFLESKVEYRIDGTVLRQYLRYIVKCCITRNQVSMLLVNKLQKLQSQKPGTYWGMKTMWPSNSLQNI